MSRRAVAAMLAGVVITAAGAADAGTGRRARRTPAAKPTASNLPRGFTWPPSRALLAAAADCERTIDASSAFRLVLTPKNDPISHKDHFHIEANPRYATAVSRR